jgi:predicted RNase H-like nuclease (RuvC/YqgF family)
MEYVLNLRGNLEEKLKRIGINNAQQLDTWSRVQQQVQAAERTMKTMGRSIGSLQERISALRAQREWIPATNREAIRATNKEIKKLESEIRNLESLNGGKLKKWFEDLKSAVPALNVINPLLAIGGAVYKVGSYLKESTGAYEAASVAEQKLAAVMNNTMGASRAEMNSILDLASAQQRLGVIDDDAQIAGAQEMATYLGKKASLEKLLPALNDMLAQQYGLNATQEQEF